MVKLTHLVFFAIFPTIVFWNVGENGKPPESPQITTNEAVSKYLQNLTGALFFIGTGTIFSTLGPLI